MSQEAMKLALEALEKADRHCSVNTEAEVFVRLSITALREALAQQALGKMAQNARELGLDYEPARDNGIVTAGGADPRTQRTWVSLTNNELQPIADEYRILFGSWVEDFARAIEAKLRSKNEDSR